MQILAMRNGSKHYGKLCAACGQRIRVHRRFILDPIETGQAYHVDHYPYGT